MKLAPNDEKQFEIEVRNIARQLWTSSGYTGAVTIDGKERDSIFVTDEVVHYVEITTSKSERNTVDNLNKIEKLLPILQKRYSGKIAKGWYITRHELTGEQGRHMDRLDGRISHQTYHQFLAKLVDSRTYLNLREVVAFGSARNAGDNSILFPEDEFIPVELRGYNTGERVAYHRFRSDFSRGPVRALVTGEFGVGKSMFARQLFMDLAKDHREGRDFSFPIYINLRDHIDSHLPYLCIHKHATSIGFTNPEHLVRAWRGGYVYLILDGFDELTPTISTKDAKRAKELRRSALELVRRFIDETQGSSVLVTGRSNFFDTNEDLIYCLGFKDSWKNLVISDFSEAQASAYLQKKGYIDNIPKWLPRRPLLIGYLAAKKLLPGMGAESDKAEDDYVAGWRHLLDAVSEREVEQVYIALTPTELLQIYGRIATKCRKKSGRRGPISLMECRDAFVEVTGVEPEGRSLTALLRLPGLVGADVQELGDELPPITQPGSRWFVDDTFLNAVGSEDLAGLLRDQYAFEVNVFHGVQHELSELGLSVALNKLNLGQRTSGILASTAQHVSDSDPQNPVLIDVLAAVRIAGNPCDLGQVTAKGLNFTAILIDSDDVDMSGVLFDDCYFEKVTVSTASTDCLPVLSECIVERLETHHSKEEIEYCMIKDTHVEEFSATYSGYEAFRQSEVDDRMVALASVLHKTFIQSVTGRKDTAMRRGVSPSQSAWIGYCLELLRKHGVIYKVKRDRETIWMPELSLMGVVKEILRDPRASKIEFMEELRLAARP